MNQDGSQTPEEQRTDPRLLTPFHRTPSSVFEVAFSSAEPTPCTKPVHIIVRNLTDTSGGTPKPVNLRKLQTIQSIIWTQEQSEQAVCFLHFFQNGFE